MSWQLGDASPSLERVLTIIGILGGWAVALGTFLWKVGISPVKRSIISGFRRTGALEDWRERADERWRQGDLDKQKWDDTLERHAEEMGEMRAELKGVRQHMDDVKVDIVAAINDRAEKSDIQLRELRDRLKDVEVTVRERREGR